MNIYRWVQRHQNNIHGNYLLSSSLRLWKGVFFLGLHTFINRSELYHHSQLSLPISKYCNFLKPKLITTPFIWGKNRKVLPNVTASILYFSARYTIFWAVFKRDHGIGSNHLPSLYSTLALNFFELVNGTLLFFIFTRYLGLGMLLEFIDGFVKSDLEFKN